MDSGAKKKVLFVIDTLQTGGAEQSLLENTIRFKQLQPVICHLYPGELLKPRFIEKGIPVYSVGIQKKYDFRNAGRKLSQIIKTEKPDILVAYLTRSEIVTRRAGKQNKLPVIGTFVSDLYSKTYNASLSLKAKAAVSYFKLLNKQTGRYCKGFIANSEAIKRSNARQLGIPLDKIEVINRGRDSKKFTFRVPAVENGKPIRFLNIGRLVPQKGQRDLILAFKQFLAGHPQATLDIAGGGPLKDSLQQLVNEEGLEKHVTLLGPRNDIPELINKYDCFVFPSHSEGFSGSVVEAMLAGLPVLVSNIPVNKEAVTHMQTGYMFEKGSVDDITKALQWYAGNRTVANEMAGKAYEHAKENFELEKIVSRLEDYLQKMISN